ncbi:BsuBI/PstI family type II restriction endonuclease [Erysipelothrix anatis]
MDKIIEAKRILNELKMPKAQQSDVCAYTLLCLAGVTNETLWSEATNEWVRIHDIIAFTRESYNVSYAENSRETIRKQALHHFRNAAIIEDNGKATNSPNYRYRLTSESLDLVKSYGTVSWTSNLNAFLEVHTSLIDLYQSKKKMKLLPLKINNFDYTLSTGKHNLLQKEIIENFAPRFAPDSICLYLGDTTFKSLVKDEEKLIQLGFEITQHDKMPDVVLFREDMNWIYFVEAVTSVGPISPKRILEIEEMTKNVTSGIVYVTSFLDFKTYKRFADQLAWETEVWIAELPEHMIHLNGDKFFGPR